VVVPFLKSLHFEVLQDVWTAVALNTNEEVDPPLPLLKSETKLKPHKVAEDLFFRSLLVSACARIGEQIIIRSVIPSNWTGQKIQYMYSGY
jgi:hypothetical protein